MKLQHNQLIECLERNCTAFSDQISNNVKKYLETEYSQTQSGLDSQHFNDQDIHFSILFNGSVYGEFIISLKKSLAVKLALGEEGCFASGKEDVLDAFKEILNISVGRIMESLGEEFDHLSITSPRVTVGELYFPDLPLFTNKITSAEDSIYCSLYIDQMKLTIASEFQEQSKKIEESEEEKEQLKRLNKAKTEFLANMSHELRTPLNGMIGHLDLLKSTPLSMIQRKQVDTVSISGDFLLSIINDILEFSKIESGQLEIEEREFDFSKSFDQLIDAISNQIFQKGLDFSVIIDPKVPKRLVSDETRLKQVLMNLIGNAIKFTPKGEVVVEVKNCNSHLQFSVKDTGVGIPEKKLTSIFGSFSQVDVSDNRKYGGSGLGLTISKSIVEALGGEMSVESEEAIGTVFSFTVPLVSGSCATTFGANLTEKAIIKSDVFISVQGKSLKENLSFYKDNYMNKNEDIKFIELENFSLKKRNATIFVDWKVWSDQSDEEREKFLVELKLMNSSLILLLKPNDFAHLDDQSSFLNDVRGAIIKYPMTPLKLIEAFDEKGIINFAQEQVDVSNRITPAAEKSNKVLLVEDNMINQQVAKAMLELIGLTVDMASDGKEAVELCQKNKYDIIFMDCQMPIMDGYEATENIRGVAKNQNKETPIVALTANAFREIKEKCFECGMTDFATKPIKKEALEDLVKRYL